MTDAVVRNGRPNSATTATVASAGTHQCTAPARHAAHGRMAAPSPKHRINTVQTLPTRALSLSRSK